MDCSNPWSFFCSKTVALVCSEANEKIMKSFLKSRLIKTGVLVKGCLIESNDFLASTVHLRIESFLSMLFNSLIISTRLDMNLLKKIILPKKACNYLMFLGGLMFRIASILAGSILIPSFEIIFPSNLPYSNPNRLFLGFKEMSYFLHLIKTCLK